MATDTLTQTQSPLIIKYPALDKNSTPPIIAVSFAIPDQSRVILSVVFTGQAG